MTPLKCPGDVEAVEFYGFVDDFARNNARIQTK